MVIRMPTAKSEARPKALSVVIRPWPLINPTMSGMLARWQGLSSTLKIPHTKEAAIATAGVPSTAWDRLVNSSSTIF